MFHIFCVKRLFFILFLTFESFFVNIRCHKHFIKTAKVKLLPAEYFRLSQSFVLADDGSPAVPNNTIYANFYFDSLQIVEITQFRSVTIEVLFANIGGLLGLWVCLRIFAVNIC